MNGGLLLSSCGAPERLLSLGECVPWGYDGLAVEVLYAEGIFLAPFDAHGELHTVCFADGTALWVLAKDAAAAIVAACLAPAAPLERRVTMVRRYEKDPSTGRFTDEETEPSSPLLPDLLSHLCEENRVLCAHAISAFYDIRDVDGLYRLERAQSTPAHASSPIALDESAALRARLLRLSRSPIFAEASYDTLALRRLLREALAEVAYEALLVYVSLFERLGGFDVLFPHALYTTLLSGRLAPYYDLCAKLEAVLN